MDKEYKDPDMIPVGTANDLRGKVFGRLTPLYRIKNEGKSRTAKWRCQCSCGNIVDVFSNNLTRNHTVSCGCIQKEKASQTHLINEIGNKYGRLTVIKQDEDYISPSGEHKIMWKCKCECGKYITTNAYSLRAGKVLSCGCLKEERISSRSEKDYLGKTFHFITVLERIAPQEENKPSLWKCRCNICGKIFTIQTSSLKKQISCGCLQDSYGVTVIKMLLKNNSIPFETEKTFKDCVFEGTQRKARFDFFVNNEYIIEFDGIQHYKATGWNTLENLFAIQKRDQFKTIWCLKNSIPIIRIPYYIQDNIKIEDLIPKTSLYLVLTDKREQGDIEEDEDELY